MNNRLSLLPLSVITVLLSSCALPPREAWRVIRTDGLFPYLAIEFGDKPVPGYVRLKSQTSAKNAIPVAHPAAALPPAGPRTAWRSTDVAIPRFPQEHARLSSNRYLTDATAPAPAPRQQVVTQSRPQTTTLTLPPPVTRPTAVSVAKSPQAAPKPAAPRQTPQPPASTPRGTELVEKKEGPAARVSSKPAAPTPVAKLQPPPSAAAKSSTAPVDAPPPAETSKPAITDLPYGVPVPGRPGLVNSPYAGKNQLVDVTGIGVGQEVKCPYSGKLFKVPAAQQAANTVKIPTEPPAESNKEPEKKP